MKTEIEAKFLNVDFNDIRAKLTDLGGVCQVPMRLMRRVLIEPAILKENGRDAFIRVRDEGDKVTVTLKDFKADSLTGAEEREIIVSDFDDAVQIFSEGGLKYQSFQESKRETWMLGEVEVVLDEWPWLAPLVEIEGPTEALVKEVSAKLGFSWDEAIFGFVDRAYKKQYPDMKTRGLIDITEVRFSDPVPAEFGKSV